MGEMSFKSIGINYMRIDNYTFSRQDYRIKSSVAHLRYLLAYEDIRNYPDDE
jgi:hypothetical protein